MGNLWNEESPLKTPEIPTIPQRIRSKIKREKLFKNRKLSTSQKNSVPKGTKYLEGRESSKGTWGTIMEKELVT